MLPPVSHSPLCEPGPHPDCKDAERARVLTTWSPSHTLAFLYNALHEKTWSTGESFEEDVQKLQNMKIVDSLPSSWLKSAILELHQIEEAVPDICLIAQSWKAPSMQF